MLRKLIVITLLLMLFCSTSTLLAGARKPKGGLIVMEAELFDDNIAQGEAEWLLKTDLPGYSRGGYMRALPKIAGSQDDPNGDSPRLDFNIEVGAGTYYVWGRALALSGGQNSFHLGLNGELKVDNVNIDPDGQWHWVSDGGASIEITEPNAYTFNCWMREAGVCVDKLILTTDPDYVPSGYAPRDPRLGPAMTIGPSTDIEAVGFGNIISINGIDVEDLMLGTTSFAEKTNVVSRAPGDADNFNLISVADAMLQPWVETNFDMPVQTIFIVEASGNDSGYIQPLDKDCVAMDDPIPFSSNSFDHAIYGVRAGELGKLAVITLEPMTYGIRILPPDDDYLSIDLVSVSGVEGQAIKVGPEVLENFEADLSAWNMDAADANYFSIAVDPIDPNNNALQLLPSDGTWTLTLPWIVGPDEKQTLSFRMLWDGDPNTAILDGVVGAADEAGINWGNYYTIMRMGGDQRLDYRDGGSYATAYETSDTLVWYNMLMDIDMASGTYDLYIDDMLIKYAAGFRSTDPNGIFKVMVRWTNKITDAVIYVDDFVVGVPEDFEEVLIDDDFDNEDLAAGGINGGFTLSTNDPHGVDSIAIETGSVAEVNVVGPLKPANAGIVSNASFDPLSPAALNEGLTVKWDVKSISQTLIYNGNTYVVQTEPNFFNGLPHVGLTFGGRNGDNVSLLYDDKNGLKGNSAFQPFENASWLDGFAFEYTISQTGWSYEVTGLNAPGDPNDPNDEGEPTILSDSGTWTDLGLPETFLTDTLDNDCHVSAHGQLFGTTLQYDRCTVSIKQPMVLEDE